MVSVYKGKGVKDVHDVAAAQADKTTVMEQWMARYASAVLRLCFVYLVDKSMAEDAMQDTFLKAWKNMAQFDNRSGTGEKAWLMRIAINVCRDYHRSAWFRHVDATSALEELPARYLRMEAEDTTLLMDVMRLPVKLKQVILLYYYQDMTMQEVAQVLKVAPSTVHHRLKKAERMLKIALTGGDENA